jgi:anti-sigma B factor antagonist
VKPASDARTPDGGEQFAEPPAPEQLMTVRTTDRPDAIIVRVEGEVDGLTASRLAAAIASAFDRADGRLPVVDLSAIDFLGSTGLRTLREAATDAANTRGLRQLRVVVDQNRPAIRPIEIAGLDQVLELFHTVDDAIASGDLH